MSWLNETEHSLSAKSPVADKATKERYLILS
jgi:hypothetical protein